MRCYSVCKQQVEFYQVTVKPGKFKPKTAICFLFTVLSDGVVQVVVALGVPAAFTVPAQPCLCNVTAQSGLQLNTALPCMPSHGPLQAGPTSQLIIVPPPGRCPELGVSWCPACGWDGGMGTHRPMGSHCSFAAPCHKLFLQWGFLGIHSCFPLQAMNSNFSEKTVIRFCILCLNRVF